ncbi:saccharopine dehydrogenase [Streptomyces hygroscopicus]|uniref:saccharopine dehydrogenase family protein n=1 Tax=Streptomyces hygroscopicus TaxID=1912 RepID=UPI00223FAC8F|nr:saccharopine dehydrogenase family protein [Streptomyces hygroscopicus]MCW7945871.1 saccharopine dehydrogenase [Streptomyces hygroscopicus]
MSDHRDLRLGTVPASGTVHWVGAGLSTGRTGLALLCARADRVVVWGRNAQRVAARMEALGLSGRVDVRALESAALASRLRLGDVVVSMLPAGEHPALLRLCRERGAHFACSSYVSDALVEAAAGAADQGVVVLTEAGLDPGIDHLAAHLLVGRARAEAGDRAEAVSFTSYCGGLPAVPDDFRYRFSWAPLGVLTALRAPARHIEGGREVTTALPWQAARRHRIGAEMFEVYPNRDSLPFVGQYGLPAGWRLETFVRGTVRNEGWLRAWQPVFEVVRGGNADRIGRLADELAERHPMRAGDRDRIVLSVRLEVRASGRHWSGEYRLDLTGDATESAMARCVSLPLAHGVTRILSRAAAPGLHRAAEEASEADRWLTALAEYGVSLEFDGTPERVAVPGGPGRG